MSFALSSIVRTRQKKSFFSLFILILLFFSFSFSSLVLASEEENNDSFDVFPSNRWSETNLGFTAEITNGLLNMSDTGDGSIDIYRLERDLRDSDGRMEFRFNHTGGEGDSDGRMELRLVDTANSQAYIRFLYLRVGNTPAQTVLDFKDIDGVTKSKTLPTAESVYPNTWYTVRIDFDVRESNFRWRMFFDNGSKVFDYSIHDVHTDRPAFFASSSIGIYLNVQSDTNNSYYEYLLDYMKAPFKEREWTQVDTPGDSDWLVDSWGNARVQDDIDDSSGWQLVVPYLDTVTATIFTNTSDNDVFISGAAGDRVTWFFRIYAVDSDDGDLHELFEVTIGFFEVIANTFRVDFGLQFDGVTLAQGAFDHTSNYDSISPRVAFSVGLTEDRSKAVMNTRLSLNGTFLDAIDFSAGGPISNVATDPSQEFLLRFDYDAELDANIEWFALLDDFGLKERGIFSDWFIANAPGILEGAAVAAASGDDILTILFRFLGNLITGAFELVIGGLQLALETALGLLEAAIGALEPFLTAISDAVDDLVEFIQAIAGEIITALGNAAQALLVAVFDALALLIDAMADLLFTIWNAIGLPDILAIANELLAYIIELIDWTLATFLDVVQLAADLSWIILVVWWIWALPVQWARAEGNPLAGLGNFIEVFFYDAFPWSILGIHLYVPQGIIFSLWMILLLPETFILFTALGL